MAKTGPIFVIATMIVAIINIAQSGDFVSNGVVDQAPILAIIGCATAILWAFADIYDGWASLTEKKDDDQRAGKFRRFLGILNGKKPEKLSEEKTDTVQ